MASFSVQRSNCEVSLLGRVASPNWTLWKKSSRFLRIPRCSFSSIRTGKTTRRHCALHLALNGLSLRFRIFCHQVCNHRAFGYIVLVCILLSSISLGAEDPVDADSVRNKVGLSHQLAFFEQISLLSDSEYGRLLLHRRVHRRDLFESKDLGKSRCECNWHF